MPSVDQRVVRQIELRKGEEVFETAAGQDGSVLVVTSQRFIDLIPAGVFGNQEAVPTSHEIGLRNGESVVNSWTGGCDSPMVLTNERVIFFLEEAHGPRIVRRDLESIADPKVDELDGAEDSPNYSLHVAGRVVGFYDEDAKAAREEISYARRVRMQKLGLEDHSGQQVLREREVIRELVRTPCRHCGQLGDITLLKCPSCGAPRS